MNGGAGSRICLKHLLDEGGGHRVDMLEQRGSAVNGTEWGARVQCCHRHRSPWLTYAMFNGHKSAMFPKLALLN